MTKEARKFFCHELGETTEERCIKECKSTQRGVKAECPESVRLHPFRGVDRPEEEQTSFLEKLLSLPTLPLRTDAGENQMIEGDEGEIHYEITKVRVLPRSKIIIYSLRTSGPEKERQEFVQQMIGILGEPFNNEQKFADSPGQYFTFWEAAKVEERLKKLGE